MNIFFLLIVVVVIVVSVIVNNNEKNEENTHFSMRDDDDFDRDARKRIEKEYPALNEYINGEKIDDVKRDVKSDIFSDLDNENNDYLKKINVEINEEKAFTKQDNISAKEESKADGLEITKGNSYQDISSERKDTLEQFEQMMKSMNSEDKKSVEESNESYTDGDISFDEFMISDLSDVDSEYSFIRELEHVRGLQKGIYGDPIIEEKPVSLKMDIWLKYKKMIRNQK